MTDTTLHNTALHYAILYYTTIQCGCGEDEYDADGDGIPECLDDCPNDPEKLEPGDCGMRRVLAVRRWCCDMRNTYCDVSTGRLWEVH